MLGDFWLFNVDITRNLWSIDLDLKTGLHVRNAQDCRATFSISPANHPCEAGIKRVVDLPSVLSIAKADMISARRHKLIPVGVIKKLAKFKKAFAFKDVGV